MDQGPVWDEGPGNTVLRQGYDPPVARGAKYSMRPLLKYFGHLLIDKCNTLKTIREQHSHEYTPQLVIHTSLPLMTG